MQYKLYLPIQSHSLSLSILKIHISFPLSLSISCILSLYWLCFKFWQNYILIILTQIFYNFLMYLIHISFYSLYILFISFCPIYFVFCILSFSLSIFYLSYYLLVFHILPMHKTQRVFFTWIQCNNQISSWWIQNIFFKYDMKIIWIEYFVVNQNTIMIQIITICNDTQSWSCGQPFKLSPEAAFLITSPLVLAFYNFGKVIWF